MARIELRNTTVAILDGLSGTGAVDNIAGYTTGATTILVDTIVLNTLVTTKVPVGARFTISTETGTPVHTVTVAGETTTDITDSLTFTPALAGAISDDDVITFLPQRVELTIGEGNITYTEAREVLYDLDRGSVVNGDVRLGDDQPLQVSLTVTFEAITTGTGETISPHDALTQTGGASEWVSAGSDPCEVYAVDIEVLHTVACGTKQDETVTFNEFRWESFVPDYDAASIAVQGRCKLTSPTAVRS